MYTVRVACPSSSEARPRQLRRVPPAALALPHPSSFLYASRPLLCTRAPPFLFYSPPLFSSSPHTSIFLDFQPLSPAPPSGCLLPTWPHCNVRTTLSPRPSLWVGVSRSLFYAPPIHRFLRDESPRGAPPVPTPTVFRHIGRVRHLPVAPRRCAHPHPRVWPPVAHRVREGAVAARGARPFPAAGVCRCRVRQVWHVGRPPRPPRRGRHPRSGAGRGGCAAAGAAGAGRGRCGGAPRGGLLPLLGLRGPLLRGRSRLWGRGGGLLVARGAPVSAVCGAGGGGGRGWRTGGDGSRGGRGGSGGGAARAKKQPPQRRSAGGGGGSAGGAV